MDTIATICNTVPCRVFSFVSTSSPRVPFYMTLARAPEIVGTPPSHMHDIGIDIPGPICGYRLGKSWSHLTTRCPAISFKEHLR